MDAFFKNHPMLNRSFSWNIFYLMIELDFSFILFIHDWVRRAIQLYIKYVQFRVFVLKIEQTFFISKNDLFEMVDMFGEQYIWFINCDSEHLGIALIFMSIHILTLKYIKCFYFLFSSLLPVSNVIFLTVCFT